MIFSRFLTSALLMASVAFSPAVAQQSFDVIPGTPALLNGIEYGIEVLNERLNDPKFDGFDRYELALFVRNTSGCAKLIFPRPTLSIEEPNLLATFDCLNASGKRMTSKKGTALAQAFMVPYSQTNKGADGKNVTTTTNIQAGYILRNGESVSNRIIVIVPGGEPPKTRVRIREIPDNF